MAPLIDDVYDVLEGTLDDVIRVRAFPRDGVEHLIAGANLRTARCAVAMLSGFMRGGHAWRPAEDGHEATTWRDVLLDVDDEYSTDYRALVARELDELVALAAPGARRPLPPGAFERLARRAGVHRRGCRSWARAVGDDMQAGWAACADPRSLVRVPLALGVSLEHLFGALCLSLLELAHDPLRELLAAAYEDPTSLAKERVLAVQAESDVDYAVTSVLSFATLPLNPLRLELMLDAAWRVLDVDALRTRFLETPGDG